MVTHTLIFQVNYSYSGSYTHYHWQRAYVLAVLFFVQYRIQRFEFVDFGSIIMGNCTVVVVSRIILLMYPTMTMVNNNYSFKSNTRSTDLKMYVFCSFPMRI